MKNVLDVTIESVVFGGDGLARVDGQVVFVPYALAGETHRIQVLSQKKKFLKAKSVEILTPSPYRQSAPCPYYGDCQGCQYQHTTYQHELEIKQQQVIESFARLAGMNDLPILNIVPSPEPYGYRNRITVHIQDRVIGFFGAEGLCDIGRCALAMPEVNEELHKLRGERQPAEGHYSLRHPNLPPSGFFQTNHSLLETTRSLVVDAAKDESSLVIEGYCGAGFFTEGLTVNASSAPRRVIAIEKDGRLLRDARRLKLDQVEWIQGAVEDHLMRLLASNDLSTTTVVVDPPREGLDPSVTRALVEHAPRRLIYLSCNPTTLARDAKKLSERWQLASLQPIDLFPRTAQIECLSVWNQPKFGS